VSYSYKYFYGSIKRVGYKVVLLTPSPTPPLKGGANLLPSPLRGEGKGEGVK